MVRNHNVFVHAVTNLVTEMSAAVLHPIIRYRPSKKYIGEGGMKMVMYIYIYIIYIYIYVYIDIDSACRPRSDLQDATMDVNPSSSQYIHISIYTYIHRGKQSIGKLSLYRLSGCLSASLIICFQYCFLSLLNFTIAAAGVHNGADGCKYGCQSIPTESEVLERYPCE